MGVARVEIRTREPFAEGQSFGSAGLYERVDGVFHLTADPGDPANRRIVDLARAERGSDGLVHFAADFSLLQPAQPERGNGHLYFHAVNRGRYNVVPFSMATAETINDGRIDPGDGFLLRRGWTILFGGWQWDVVRRPGYLGLEAPQALDDSGRPIQGTVLVQFQPSDPYRYQLLAHWPLNPPPGNPEFQHRPYPAADVDDPDAVLTVRDSNNAERVVIPRSRWRFAREVNGEVISDESHIWLADGFQTGPNLRGDLSDPDMSGSPGPVCSRCEIRCRFCATLGRGTLRRAESATRWGLVRRSVADSCASSSTRG